ncbi:hypothetical protein CONPUDRAFT_136429 [Coniophora puteana RWD-64-598 SS2]|uniref:Uncharacterized protein n=1 Tax=Coniophora puteana (strain RWD-64-598) TaxID=741705 RepID=A0A5M3MXN7_CONPW|nr:uncharacterized protein CONPUDRAFT_136429 [Coniophora puteana RWD-64-598 SS2]EIW83391.1 hypothetical protein CONPUDRAFT_136429 [Coniophora puteana RWD-64-598 SS2]
MNSSDMRPHLSLSIPCESPFAFTQCRRQLDTIDEHEPGWRALGMEKGGDIRDSSGDTSPAHTGSGTSASYPSSSASSSPVSVSASTSTSSSPSIVPSPGSETKHPKPSLRINTNIFAGEAIVGFCLSEDYDFDERPPGMVEPDDDPLPSESCCEPGYPPGLVPVSASRAPGWGGLSATDATNEGVGADGSADQHERSSERV